MSCNRTRQMLDAWIDGELDPATGQQLAQHLEGCADCRARHSEREALRATVRAAVAPMAAPAALQLAVLRGIRAAPAPTANRTQRLLSWWQAGVLATGSAAVAAAATFFMTGPATGPTQQEVAGQVAALHARSLAGDGLIEIASSERHVVKPWFHGKIDFAPPVRDLSAEGFALLGARMERVGGRPAVALVYRIRKHPVNLFVWRGEQGRATPLAFETVHGFTVGQWSSGGLDFAAVSDVEAQDLAKLARQE